MSESKVKLRSNREASNTVTSYHECQTIKRLTRSSLKNTGNRSISNKLNFADFSFETPKKKSIKSSSTSLTKKKANKSPAKTYAIVDCATTTPRLRSGRNTTDKQSSSVLTPARRGRSEKSKSQSQVITENASNVVESIGNALRRSTRQKTPMKKNLNDSEDEQLDNSNSGEEEYRPTGKESDEDEEMEDSEEDDDEEEEEEIKTAGQMAKNIGKSNPTRSSIKRKNFSDQFEEETEGGTHLLRGDCTGLSLNATRFELSAESDHESSAEEDEDTDENGMYKLNYFIASASQSKTSSNTLKDLDLSVLQGNFFKALQPEQEQLVNQRHEKKLFPKMFFLMREQFNIILYGLGSKKELLDLFCKQWLSDEAHFTIFGFFSELNLRHILQALAEPFQSSYVDENSLIEAAEALEKDMYIVIHSMDLLFSNEPKVKRFFCNLLKRASYRVHVIGSCDHVHSAMLFDNSENQVCNWIWLDATTFQNYQLERAYLSSNMKNSKGNLQSSLEWQHLTISSLSHVYNSLTANAKQIFTLILNYWIENCSTPNDKKDDNRPDEMECEGILFTHLLEMCRENFLVNSELTLKSQLTEFKDHKLIRSYKTAGVERIQVMVEKKTIQKFLEKITE